MSLSIGLLSYRSHPYSGGQGIYVKHLSRALVQLGHKVDIISGPPYPELSQGVNLIKIPRLRMYGAGLERINIKQALTIPVLGPYVLLNISGIDSKLDFQIFSDR